MLRRQVWIGRVPVDVLTRTEALRSIGELVESKVGGFVFTPNVDHVVMADDVDELATAYGLARLSLADGVPILWASRLLGQPLPEKLSGSDMVLPIAEAAANAGWSVYLLGGLPGSAEEAAERLRKLFPSIRIAGTDDAMLSLRPYDTDTMDALARVKAARPDILFMGLGAPKQELLLHRASEYLAPTVGFGIGASIDFLAGRLQRSPAWMSRVGLEWFYRLCSEPRRLWRRYLLRDPRFLGIVMRSLRAPRAGRISARPLPPAPARAS